MCPHLDQPSLVVLRTRDVYSGAEGFLLDLDQGTAYHIRRTESLCKTWQLGVAS
jgi:hypothetical protein